jgi:glycosyltransferase involved in cell wall biosynthesis
VDHQAWVLPLEGSEAFRGGLVTASQRFGPSVPRVAATMPVAFEENDVERVLASFLPAAWEWVVGVDRKSTDRTREIVERYADVVADFAIEPWSFAAARNVGIDHCSAPWIFMTEGHEHLDQDVSVASLMDVGKHGIEAATFNILRDTGGSQDADGQVFEVPSIFRNHPAMRFSDTGGVHNTLEIDGYAPSYGLRGPVCFRLVGGIIRTWHKAHPVNRARREVQRTAMNPRALDDYVEQGGERTPRALFYAGQEYAGIPGKERLAVRRFVQYLRRPDRGFDEQTYEAHLILGDLLMGLRKPRLAAAIAKRGLAFNVCRAELHVLLGDAHAVLEDWHTARQCYAHAAGVPLPAFSHLFLRKSYYRSVPWRGLANACLHLGEIANAVHAARSALHYDPSDELAQRILARYGGQAVA